MEAEEIAATLADHGARIANLEGWQKTQNGSLQRLDGRVWKLQLWMMGTMASSLLTLAGVVAAFFLRR